MTIAEMQQKMSSGELTSAAITRGYLEQIEALDREGPAVNAVIELNPDAPAIAAARDKERAAGRLRGPLHGIPILIKDNIDTHDRMQTTSGSLALEGSVAPRDAFIVGRLRQAGAVLLGKSNLSEWANFRGRHSVSGWSSRGGLTRNPYALDRSACGSSSGSGAAVAANMCAAAVGTETDGSITCPAQTNGIVGIKPTLGLLSRSGIVPISHSQDTAGPMARTVADAAILLGAMTGVDRRDAATQRSRRAFKDYTRFLDPRGLRGARIGVARAMAGSDPRILKIFDAAIDCMRQLGAVIVDPVSVPNFKKLGKPEMEVLHFEFLTDLDAYLASRGAKCRVHSMADVVRFNEQHKAIVMPYFGQEHMSAALETASLARRKYRDALAESRRLARRAGLDVPLRKHRLDAIVVPTGGPAWMIDLVNGDALAWDDIESTSAAAVAGYPHITVPAGYIYGLPVGLSFVAGAWQEPALIRLASAFERATRVRRPPRFLAHAPAGDAG